MQSAQDLKNAYVYIVDNTVNVVGCIVDHKVILTCLASSQDTYDTYEPIVHPTGSTCMHYSPKMECNQLKIWKMHMCTLWTTQ